MIDFLEVHRVADLLSKERVKDKAYFELMLDRIVLKEAHEIAYWDILEVEEDGQTAREESDPRKCLCEQIKGIFRGSEL